ncbi:carbonic anhydrase-related protein 10-like [Cydia amplana]|uniref:carbonic anhydrase-related protein 10-like n=1 Tax=Cydia amplana TaxID=1869771 RepID=UPI002FE57409
MHQCSLFILTLLCVSVKDISGSWEEWWTYDGISGPGFWGLINPQWSMCNKGRRQSPVNIEPDKLLFDPWLRDIQFDKHKVSGVLQNTGQSLVFRVEKDSKHQVNISGGPLSYRYQFEEIYFHYGLEDNRGSEHQIDHHTFPGEIQLYGFNKELYHNMSEAQHKSQGIVGISLMVQIGEPTNKELRLITSAFNRVNYRGSSVSIKHLPLSSLLPNTQQYLTYEGSTTHPGCWETAVWIIFNKPIYISKQEMYALRRLMQGSDVSPKAPLGNNARPTQPLHHRTVRTNINFNKQGSQINSNCPDMYRNMHYTARYSRKIRTTKSIACKPKHVQKKCRKKQHNGLVNTTFGIGARKT